MTSSTDHEASTTGIPRMPTFFGRQGGPRQQVFSLDRHPYTEGTTLSSWIAIHADSSQLTALLPHAFELAEPLLIIEGASLSRLPWLAGRGYELISVSVPVVFVGQGSRIVGRLELVTWENHADPIVSGREELGFNKVFADEITCEVDEAAGLVNWSASWGGTRFLHFEVLLDSPLTSMPTWRSGPTFHHRVLPRTGQWGELEVEQITANTDATAAMSLVSARRGSGSARFVAGTFQELPTLVHIVNALAGIPLGEVRDAGHAVLTGWSDLAEMKIVATRAVEPPAIHELT